MNVVLQITTSFSCYSEGASQQTLEVRDGNQDDLLVRIANPDDQIALQDGREFRLGLLFPGPQSNVEIGGMGIFAEANLTIVDDDG